MKAIIIALLVLATVPLTAGDLRSLSPGDTVSAFTLRDYDGKEHSLDSLMGGHRYAVIMFIATRCPVSNAYNGRMADLYAAYSAKDVAFVGINSNKSEDAAEVKEHAKENKLPFTILKDPGNAVADAYGALVTPEIFVVDAKMKLLYHGRIDDNQKIEKVQRKDLAGALDALLAGKEVSGDQPRAFGCTIKRVDN